MTTNDPRQVSSEGLNPNLAAAVDTIVAALVATSDTQTAYNAGQRFAPVVELLKQIQPAE